MKSYYVPDSVIYAPRDNDPPAIAVLRNIIRHDDDKDCRWCSKRGWNVSGDPHPHDNHCPFQLAINVLVDYEAGQQEGV